METDKYLEAAKIIAECKPSKLPYVLAVLKQGGIELKPEQLKEAKLNIKDRERYATELRKAKGHDGWLYTDDPTALRLRELYDCGKSITKLSSVSGIHRSCLYMYIRGKQKPNPATAKLINDAITQLYS